MLMLSIDFDHMLHHRLLLIDQVWDGKAFGPDQGPEIMGYCETLIIVWKTVD